MEQLEMEGPEAPPEQVFEATMSAIVGAGADARRLVRVADWTMSVWSTYGDDEPRIRDVDLATRLGFERPRDVRKLVERIWPENRRPHVRATVARTSMPRGGEREFTVWEYWLTEAEALKLTARSETPIADAILDEMIRVYRLAIRGLLTPVRTVPPPAQTPTLDDVRRAAEAAVNEQLARLAQALSGHTAPTSGHPPPAPSTRMKHAPKPGGSGPQLTLRNARHYFKRRERCWRDVPADVTWEAWLASPAGRQWCAARAITDPASVAP